MTTQKRARGRCARLLLLVPLIASCALTPSSERPSAGAIHGRVTLGSTGGFPDQAAPLVVLARPLSPSPAAPIETTRLRRVDGAFSPPFVVVPVGARVEVENEEKICHGFFSSSTPNAFDLGVMRPGTSNAVRFERPGFVHVYCSLHAERQATILVAPTRHFAIVGPNGTFTIGNLTPGAYELETWREGRPAHCVDVTVGASGPTVVEFTLDAAGTRRS